MEKDKLVENISCMKCGSTNLKASVDKNFIDTYVTCNDCNNVDVWKIRDGKLQDLVRCSLCGIATTKIITNKVRSFPDWRYPCLEHLDDIYALCEKCYDENIEELEEKNEKVNIERVSENIKNLKNKLSDERKRIGPIFLTEKQVKYIIALIEDDDDFSSDMCEDIEDDFEYEETKKIYKAWHKNLLDILKKMKE